MRFARTQPFDGEPAAKMLTVAVLAPGADRDDLPAQVVRVLAGLQQNSDIALHLHPAAEPDREAISPALSALLSVERRLMPSPRRNALPQIAEVPVDKASTQRQSDFDLILDFGGGPVDLALARGARHGLWRVIAQPLHAALEDAPLTEAWLIRHTGADVRLVARAVYDTKPLATHNADYVLEKSAQMIVREVNRCILDGKPADLGPYRAPDSTARIGALGYLSQTAHKAWNRLHNRIAQRRGRFRRGFTLRMGQGAAHDFDPARSKAVPMPDVALWADPFLIRHEGTLYCFFEDVDPVAWRGHISVGRVSAQGIEDVQTALKLPHHMSYPFVFHHDGHLLMMPEVHAAGRLDIWRCTRFPDRWEIHASALEGTPVCDSVLLQREGEWWLFTHISHDRFGDFCSDLHVFRVDGPQLTNLVPHRLNPVVTDASTARGGGRIHQAGGRLLRFSQDNTRGGYGGALNVMEITRLDLDHYEERRLRHITPDFAPGLSGCHHFDAEDGWFVIDVREA